jgi:hypothetical protein
VRADLGVTVDHGESVIFFCRVSLGWLGGCSVLGEDSAQWAMFLFACEWAGLDASK